MIESRPREDQVSNAPDNVLIYVPESESAAKSILLQQGARTGFFALHKRAENGSADAQAVIALLFLLGWVKDQALIEEAKFWSTKSAESKNAFGQWVKAWTCMEMGASVAGIENFLMSAEQSFPPSIYTIGGFSYSGILLPQSHQLGMELIRRAAKLGNLAAKMSIEILYKRGDAGGLNRIMGSTVLPVSGRLRGLWHSLARRKFDLDRLVYARSIVLENEFRRKSQSERVDNRFEKRVAELIPSTRRIER